MTFFLNLFERLRCSANYFNSKYSPLLCLQIQYEVIPDIDLIGRQAQRPELDKVQWAFLDQGSGHNDDRSILRFILHGLQCLVGLIQ